MNNRYLSAITILILFLTCDGAFAFCSGGSVSNVVMGDATLAIEVTKFPSGEKKYVIDDDGLVALNVAASFCYDQIASQTDDSQLLKCAAGVKKLINKAALRSQAYFREKTNPKELERTFQDPADRALFTSQQQSSVDHAKKFAILMTTPPVTGASFKAAFQSLQLANENHTYAVVPDAGKTAGPDQLKPIPELMREFYSNLPYVTSGGTRPRVSATRCGGAVLTQANIDVIAAGDWKPRLASQTGGAVKVSK